MQGITLGGVKGGTVRDNYMDSPTSNLNEGNCPSVYFLKVDKPYINDDPTKPNPNYGDTGVQNCTVTNNAWPLQAGQKVLKYGNGDIAGLGGNSVSANLIAPGSMPVGWQASTHPTRTRSAIWRGGIEGGGSNDRTPSRRLVDRDQGGHRGDPLHGSPGCRSHMVGATLTASNSEVAKSVQSIQNGLDRNLADDRSRSSRSTAGSAPETQAAATTATLQAISGNLTQLGRTSAGQAQLATDLRELRQAIEKGKANAR